MRQNFLAPLFIILLLFSLTGCDIKTETQQALDLHNAADSVIDPLAELKAGNRRFMEDHPVHPHQTIERIRALEIDQHPIAVVISCSDSRVPPELIFDQGLGDLFVVRNAGNIVDNLELGSVEYAVEHLHTPLVVVLGHERCGAIAAFMEHKNDSIPNHIQHIINYIRAEPEEQALDEQHHNYAHLALEANVHHGVDVLQRSEPILARAIANNQLRVIGAIYQMDTGEVQWLEQD